MKMTDKVSFRAKVLRKKDWSRYDAYLQDRQILQTINRKVMVWTVKSKQYLEPVPWGPVFWKAFLTVDWSTFGWLERYLTFFSTV